MQEYVVGFMFSDSADRVLLIRKNRPKWQAGLLNGIGGHIEAGENPLQAMVREFREETGFEHGDWRQYLVFEFAGGRVYVFEARSDAAVANARTMTDEELIVSSSIVPQDALQNLHWMIPMALDEQARAARVSASDENPLWLATAA